MTARVTDNRLRLSNVGDIDLGRTRMFHWRNLVGSYGTSSNATHSNLNHE